MFIDEATISVSGGRGGNGVARFFPGYKTGPSGGDGGRGGDLYILSDPNLSDLHTYAGTKHITAGDAGDGENFCKSGKNGEDRTIRMPVGTMITDIETQETWECMVMPEPILIARGGKGGRGNLKFVSSINRSPSQAEPGVAGQKRNLRLVQRLIADFGLIGLPNAGKSSLLNLLTAARVKTAMYPFTTLEPNLGACGSRILADIPGLIEGASHGRGLGVRFLKHVEKTPHLLHCISAESEDVTKVYETVRTEMGQYNPALLEKPETILLTKVDLLTASQQTRLVGVLKKLNPHVLSVSIYQPNEVARLQKYILSHSVTTS